MLIAPELVEQALKGNEAAFNRIVVAYRKRIFGTLARLVSRPEDMDDIAQEVFLRLYLSLPDLKSPESIEPWLYRLTINVAYDYLRKRRRRAEDRMSDLSEEKAFLADASAARLASSRERQLSQVKNLVDRLLQSVPAEDRILLLLKEVEGLSMKDLENIYSVKENALKVRLFRARQRVLKAYQRSIANGPARAPKRIGA